MEELVAACHERVSLAMPTRIQECASEFEIERIELFPHLLIKHFWEDSETLNSELANLVLVKEVADPGISTTNVGGWHSKKNFQSWNGECVLTLLRRIRVFGAFMVNEACGTSFLTLPADWEIQAWANINRAGDRNKFHTHVRNSNLWSGIYYVQSGTSQMDNEEVARTVFVDQFQPTAKSDEDRRSRFCVDPVPGLMLLFPSSLGHRVEEHVGDSERITVAFNLKHVNFSTLYYDIEKKG